MPFLLRNRNHTETRYVRLNPKLCEACWQCIEVCPQHVLGKVEFGPHRHAHVDRAEDCRGCKKCVAICPHGALTAIVSPQ